MNNKLKKEKVIWKALSEKVSDINIKDKLINRRRKKLSSGVIGSEQKLKEMEEKVSTWIYYVERFLIINERWCLQIDGAHRNHRGNRKNSLT